MSTLRACLLGLLVGACALAGAPVAGAVSVLPTLGGGVTVAGAVASPTTYSLAQLQAMPQTSVEVLGHMDAGVSLETLVNLSHPVLPSAKNPLLRVTVAVAGSPGRSVTFAVGELDPSFGNHPAILVLASDGATLRDAPDLVVPGDARLAARFVRHVTRLTVGVQSPTPTTPATPGGITVHDGGRAIALSPAVLAALPQVPLTVSFQAGSSPQTHQEVGPTLDSVLVADHIRPWSVAWVAAVAGSDGYVATVTPSEAEVGGRPLLISLREDGAPQAQPRLIVDGDVKGGRYVSGVNDLYVARAQPFWANLLAGLLVRI